MMRPITTIRSAAVQTATTGHRPTNQQATCLCGQPWTVEHFANKISEAAGGANVNTATGGQWEVDLDE
jgi:hypothetical protein